MAIPERVPLNPGAPRLGVLHPVMALLAILLGHTVLALAMRQIPAFATVHALATAAVGIYIAAMSPRPTRILYLAAYIAGAEVLWRMTNASVFWEFGKYLTVGLLVIAIVRLGRPSRAGLWPLVYFALLLPAIWATLSAQDEATAISDISFNLSGPLSLAVATVFLGQLRRDEIDLEKMVYGFLGPVIGIAVLTGVGAYGNKILFGLDSNFATSGGFGPNQVSASLGLGVLAAGILALHAESGIRHRALVVGIMLALGVQSALTFSRGGLYTACLAALFGGLWLLRSPRTRLRLVLGTVAILVIAYTVVLPRLDAFTGGLMSARFLSANLTHRDELVREDLIAWAENPVLGAGPGGTKAFHFDATVAHTEFTRLLGEHGLLGCAALLLLFYMGAAAIWKTRARRSRALAVTLVAWSGLFMLGAGMRLVAPGLAFGLALACSAPDRRYPQVLRRWPTPLRVPSGVALDVGPDQPGSQVNPPMKGRSPSAPFQS